MHHEGNLQSARATYLTGRNRNLSYLLNHRFSWMREHLLGLDRGIELGAGIGASQDILHEIKIELTDISDNEWLDHKNVNALDTSFDSCSFDFVIASNMLHHVAKPTIFFNEVSRICKPGGLLLLNEAHTSFMSKLILIVMKHEGFDDNARVFDPEFICNDPDDPWSANCSIPKLLFGDIGEFEANFPDWKVVHDSKHEFLIFLNSGGVTAKFFYLPLPAILLRLTNAIDTVLIKLAPNFFALGRHIVLKKRAI